MPLLDFLVRNSIENPAIPISTDEVLKVLGTTADSAAGIQVTARKSLGLSALWRGTNTLTGDLAKIPLEVKRETEDGGKVRAIDHPAYQLLRRRPYPNMTPFRWKKAIFFHAIFRGNGYAYIHRAGGTRAGKPVKLQLLPPTPDTFPIEVDGERYYITLGRDGGQVKLRAEDVIHICGLSYEGLEGLDLITVMADVLGLQIAQQKNAGRFFDRGMQTAGFVTAPRRLTDKEMADLRAGFEKMNSGIDNAQRPGILHGGLGWINLAIDPRKSQLLDSRRFGLIEMSNLLCMPPHKLGDDSRTSYKSLEEENSDYVESTLDQWMVNAEEELEEKLLTEKERESDSIDIEFNRQALMRVASKDRAEFYYRLREMGSINANQIARREGLPPLGPKGDVYYVPQNWQPMGETAAAPAKPAKGGGSPPRNEIPASCVAAHRAAIADRAAQLLKIECDKTLAAAAKPAEFLNWLDRFAPQHAAKLAEAIEPAIAAWIATAGCPGAAYYHAWTAAQTHMAFSRRELSRACEVPAAELAAAVAALVATWPARAADLAAWIIHITGRPLAFGG